MDVFDLQAKITLDTSGYKKALSAAAGDMQAFGSTVEGIVGAIGTAFTTAFAAASAGTAALVKGALEEYARFEQLVGGVDTLFKGSSGTLQEYADAAFQTAGMSANDYMDTATSFAASLIQALEGDTEAAVDMVDMAVTDMADNANKMGTDIGSIQHAYQGFAKQNYTMLDNLKLGYGGTKSEMARLINDTGILGDTIVEVSTMTKQGNFEEVVSFDTVVEAIHAVQENMGITGTTAQEAAYTIEGSVASMKAAWSNWLVGLGDENADLSGLTDSLVGSFTTVVDNVLPVVGRIGESLGQVFTDLTGIDLTPVTETFEGLKTSLTDISTAFAEGGATAAFETLTGKLSELTGLDLSGVTEAFTGIGEAISTIGAGFAEGGLEGGFDALVGQIEQLTGLDLSGVSEAFSKLSEAFAGIKESFETGGISGGITDLAAAFTDLTGIDITTLVDNFLAMAQAFSGIGEAVAEGGVIGALDMLARVFADLTGIDLTGIIDALANAIPMLLTTGENVLGALEQVVQSIWEYITTAIPGLVQELVSAISGFFEAFAGYLQEFWKWMEPLVTFLKETFLDGIMVAWEQIQILIEMIIGAISGVLQMFEGFFDGVTAALQGDFEAAAEAVKTAWDGVLVFFGSVADGIKGLFDGIVGYFAEIGANMFAGLKSGFENVAEWASDVGNSIKGAFKKVFDINSPSRVFAEYGKFMAQGLEVGWNSEMDSIQRTMSDGLLMHGKVDFADSAIGKASAATVNGMFAASGGSSGGGHTINLVVDGRILAQVVFDPLNGIIKQKGVTLGA